MGVKMRMNLLFILLFQSINSAYGVELMKIVSKILLSLYDGGSFSLEDSPKTKMYVIGAGFGRTGTESLCAAFTSLGFKTYHGTKALLYGHLPHWNEWYSKQNDHIFELLQNEGFDATTDFPASLSYNKFIEINPDAKVVLSVHPKGSEGWAQSFLNVFVFYHVFFFLT